MNALQLTDLVQTDIHRLSIVVSLSVLQIKPPGQSISGYVSDLRKIFPAHAIGGFIGSSDDTHGRRKTPALENDAGNLKDKTVTGSVAKAAEVVVRPTKPPRRTTSRKRKRKLTTEERAALAHLEAVGKIELTPEMHEFAKDCPLIFNGPFRMMSLYNGLMNDTSNSKSFSNVSHATLLSNAVNVVHGLGKLLQFVLDISVKASKSLSPTINPLDTITSMKTLLDCTLRAVFSVSNHSSSSISGIPAGGKDHKTATKKKRSPPSQCSPTSVTELNRLFLPLTSHIVVPILTSFTSISQALLSSSPTSLNSSSHSTAGYERTSDSGSATISELTLRHSIDIRSSLYHLICHILTIISSALPPSATSRPDANDFNNIRHSITLCALKEIYQLYCFSFPDKMLGQEFLGASACASGTGSIHASSPYSLTRIDVPGENDLHVPLAVAPLLPVAVLPQTPPHTSTGMVSPECSTQLMSTITEPAFHLVQKETIQPTEDIVPEQVRQGLPQSDNLPSQARKDSLSYLCAILHWILSDSLLSNIEADNLNVDSALGCEDALLTDLASKNRGGRVPTPNLLREATDAVQASVVQDANSLMRFWTVDLLSELLSMCRRDMSIRLFSSWKCGGGTQEISEDEQDIILGVIEKASAVA